MAGVDVSLSVSVNKLDAGGARVARQIAVPPQLFSSVSQATRVTDTVEVRSAASVIVCPYIISQSDIRGGKVKQITNPIVNRNDMVTPNMFM